MPDTELLKAALQRELDLLEEMGQELWLHAAHAPSDVRRDLHRLDLRFRFAQAELERLGAQSSERRDEIVKELRDLLEELRQGYTELAQHAC